MNAIMHRLYESTSPVRFYWFSDRIEVQNPGGLFGEATPENFPRQNSYRNPVIAEAMTAVAASTEPAAVITLVHVREKGLRFLMGHDAVTVGVDAVFAELFKQPGLMLCIEWCKGLPITRPRGREACQRQNGCRQ